MSRRLLLSASACVAVLLAACGSSQSTSTTTSASPTGSASASASESNQHVFEADHFAADALVDAVVTEDCTLSGGTKTTCASVTIAGYPSTYEVGPFCPTTITTPASAAGIWFDGTGVYDLSGAFIKNLATFYNDSEWHMYDSAGMVKVTDTKEAFDGAARPDVLPEYRNYCVEGRLAWLPDGKAIQTTMLIPTTPVKASAASSAHPGNLGVTLDGVVIAESAPVDAILGAHTIASFDDCGGHFNPVAGYHLHGVTGCGLLEADAAAGETAMFGYAADGYPIHLPLSEADVAAANLDQCNGHSTESEGYHYHANVPAKNAILPCLMGEYVSTGGPGGPPQGAPAGGGQNGAGQAGGGVDLTSVAAQLGVTAHELADAMETGDATAAAQMLGTTPEAMAKKLGMSVADIQTFLTSQPASTPTPSAS